jgi:hypothetical protein
MTDPGGDPARVTTPSRGDPSVFVTHRLGPAAGARHHTPPSPGISMHEPLVTPPIGAIADEPTTARAISIDAACG